MTTKEFWNKVLELKDDVQLCSFFIMDILDEMSMDNPEQFREVFQTAQGYLNELSTSSMRAILVIAYWNKHLIEAKTHDELYSAIYEKMVAIRGEAIANRLLKWLH